MTDPTTTLDPIIVKAHMAPVVMSESTKLIVIAGLAMVCDHFMHSETAIIAVLAASGAVLTGVSAIWSRVHNWKVLRYFAHLLPDEVATVGKPPA